ncbi:MAG: polysaccharide biosynthesis/export family protein [Stellaceae bacterium]
MLLPVLVLGACAGPANTVPYPPRVASLPPPAYRVAPGDTLNLKFLYSPELDEQQTVGLDGDVSFQYAPNLHVAGETIPEARRTIMAAYRKTLMNPAAELSIKGPLQWKVFVIGEVARPGEFTTKGPPLTLVQAIARAGGLKESADGGNVVLLRRQGDVEHAYDVSFTNAVEHRSPTADIRLANRDILYVPRTGVAKLGVDWRQYVMQFVPPNVSFAFGSTRYVP